MHKNFKGIISDSRWGTPSPDDYQLIIKTLASADLKQEDIFVYPVRLCDNKVDSANEFFSEKSLNELAELFVGMPGIYNHDWKDAREIHSRIYKTEVIEEDNGYKYLLGYAYTTDDAVIKGIKEGMLKEVSVGFETGKVSEPDADGVSCIETVTRAFEYSFVTVPCQANARVLKNKNRGDEDMDLQEQIKALTDENAKLKATIKSMNLKSSLDSLFGELPPKAESARELACKILEEKHFFDEDGNLNVDAAMNLLQTEYDYLFDKNMAEEGNKSADEDTKSEDEDVKSEDEGDVEVKVDEDLETKEEVEVKEEDTAVEDKVDEETDAIQSYLKAHKIKSAGKTLGFTHTSKEVKSTSTNKVIKSAGMTRF